MEMDEDSLVKLKCYNHAQVSKCFLDLFFKNFFVLISVTVVEIPGGPFPHADFCCSCSFLPQRN